MRIATGEAVPGAVVEDPKEPNGRRFLFVPSVGFGSNKPLQQGWDIAVTCIVTILPVALCAAVMLRLRAEVVREYVIAARSGRRPPSLTTPELDSRVAPPMPTLNVTTGPAEGRSVDVGDGIVIGRGDADLSIDDDELSRQHVRVRPIDGGVVVEDLGSTNGSWLNGERINGAVVVTRSGILRVGRSEISIAVEPADSTVVGETPGELRLSDATVIREIPFVSIRQVCFRTCAGRSSRPPGPATRKRAMFLA